MVERKTLLGLLITGSLLSLFGVVVIMHPREHVEPAGPEASILAEPIPDSAANADAASPGQDQALAQALSMAIERTLADRRAEPTTDEIPPRAVISAARPATPESSEPNREMPPLGAPAVAVCPPIVAPTPAGPSEARANLLRPVPVEPGNITIVRPPVREGWSGSVTVSLRPPSQPGSTESFIVPPVASGDPASLSSRAGVTRIIPPPMPAAPRAATRNKSKPFTGSFACRLNEANVLELPGPVRELVQGRGPEMLYLTLGTDGCLLLRTAFALEEKLSRLPEEDARVRHFQRSYLAATEKVRVEKNGCITLPDSMVRNASLREEVVLIGVWDHLELWDAQRWHQYLGRNPTVRKPTSGDSGEIIKGDGEPRNGEESGR